MTTGIAPKATATLTGTVAQDDIPLDPKAPGGGLVAAATDMVQGMTKQSYNKANVTAFMFVMGICSYLFYQMSDQAKADRAFAHEMYATSMKTAESNQAAFKAVIDKQFESLNTTNHNLAGMSNVMAEFMASMRTIQTDVKALNTHLGRAPAAGLIPKDGIAIEKPPEGVSNCQCDNCPSDCKCGCKQNGICICKDCDCCKKHKTP